MLSPPGATFRTQKKKNVNKRKLSLCLNWNFSRFLCNTRPMSLRVFVLHCEGGDVERRVLLLSTCSVGPPETTDILFPSSLKSSQWWPESNSTPPALQNKKNRNKIREIWVQISKMICQQNRNKYSQRTHRYLRTRRKTSGRKDRIIS